MLLNNINPSIVKELKSLRIDLSIFWGLELAIEGEKQTLSKFDWITKHLVRKGWITDELDTTNLGQSLYNELMSSNRENKEIKAKNKVREANKQINEGFDEWWKCYPSSNKFSFNGRTFTGVQSKKLNKGNCEDLWNSIVLSGDFSPLQIISGTKKHILEAKKESIKNNSNQLTFIPNSERYLRERVFEPFISDTEEEVNDSSDYDDNLFREIEID